MKPSHRTLNKLLLMTKDELVNLLDTHSTSRGEHSWVFLPLKPKGKPCLVTHIDTVWDKERGPKEKFLIEDAKKGLIYSPQGLGADDRAGVYALLHLYYQLPSHLRPILLFTDLEESGGGGAIEASEIFHEDLSHSTHLIELDRRGGRDCVFYSGEPLEYREYIESFGFREGRGSFSDISILGPSLGLCSTNLSIGYYNEHTKSEYLSLKAMNSTIQKVQKLLSLGDKKVWELLPCPESTPLGREWWDLEGLDLEGLDPQEGIQTCPKCEEEFTKEEFNHYGTCPMCGSLIYGWEYKERYE